MSVHVLEHRSRVSQLVQGAERGLLIATEGAAALLVAVELVLLLVSVVARYGFRHSLVWSDALSSLLFLWLAMLSATVALQRNDHMRMKALIHAASGRWRAFWEAVAVVAPLVFLLLMIRPTLDYVANEFNLTDPALDISQGWRAAAMPVGFGLMIIASLVRLGRLARVSDKAAILAAIAAIGVIALALLVGQTYLEGLGSYALLFFFVGIVGVGVFGGVPIAFAFGLASYGYLALTTDLPLLVMASRIDHGMSQIVLLAVPLFVLLGMLMEMTGMAKALVTFLADLVGRVPGGLSYVLIAGMYLVSGISGSKSADMAALAPVLFPEMKARGVPPGEFIALLSATAAQTETIPPSLVLIILGSVTGVSIGALFTGGLLPGLVVGLMLCFIVWRRSRGSRGPVAPFSRGGLLKSFGFALPALALPFVIRFAVIDGVATATEVSTIGVVYASLAGLLFYRQFAWSRVWPMLVSTAALTGAILLIIGAATSMAWCLTQSGFSDTLVDVFAQLPGGRVVFILASIAVFVVLGSVLEGIPAIVLFGPLLFPIAVQVGMSEVQYAMIAILSMGIGLFSPPFGVGYYTACAISKVDPVEGMRPMLGYILALAAGLALVATIPWISTGFL